MSGEEASSRSIPPSSQRSHHSGRRRESRPQQDFTAQASLLVDRSELSLRETLSLALNNEEFIDTIFLVGQDKCEIKCHRLILSSQSSVFFEMFASRNNPQEALARIQLSLSDPFNFRGFIKFLYTGDVDIPIENVISCCALAMEYKVNSFNVECKKMLKNKINCQNAVKIFQQAGQKSNFDIERIAKDFIYENAQQIFTPDIIVEFSYHSLRDLLAKDQLIIDEFSLYKAVLKWAEYRCIKSGKDPNYKTSIREELDELFYLVRYPLMTPEEFVLQTANSGIFSAAETYAILSIISLPNSAKKDKLGRISEFNVHSRNVHRYFVNRFTSGIGKWINNYNDFRWATRFKVNKAISVISLGLYGPADTFTAQYQIKIEILNEDMTTALGTTEVNRSFKVVEGIFHVEFINPGPVAVKPDVWYTASFYIVKGPPTLTGLQVGNTCVAVNSKDRTSTSFHFEFDSAVEGNTDFQIPEICFQPSKSLTHSL